MPLIGKGVFGAACDTRLENIQHFSMLRGLLEDNHHFQFAAEQLDRVGAAYKLRFGTRLPGPTEVNQNPDSSLTIHWKGFALYCARDFLGWLLPGMPEPMAQLHPEVNGVPNMVLDAIHVASKATTQGP